MSLSNMIIKPTFMSIDENTVVNVNHIISMEQVTSGDLQTTTFIKMIGGNGHVFNGSLSEIREMLYPKSTLSIDASIENAMKNNGKLCEASE